MLENLSKNQRMWLTAGLVVLILLAVVVMFHGTRAIGEPDHQIARPMNTEETEAQIKKIQQNPNMPEQAKQIQIQMLRAHETPPNGTPSNAHP
ncbi:MAG TPA: hypothetical protein VFA07_18740 [Chthonomonadaceae bacterium]|nr:hypothetical protein [Chthonomonadaceae bacterium]